MKFGVRKTFIKWVKLLNKGIKAYILQWGSLSEEIQLKEDADKEIP